MKISMGSWAFTFGPYAEDPMPFDATVRRLCSAGFDGVEICGFPPHITLEDYPDGNSRKGVVRFLKANHLEVSGYNADLSSINPCTDGNRERYLDLFSRSVDMALALGSPSIRVDSVAAPGSIDDREYQAAFNRLAETWRKCAGIAEKNGVRLVWEFEPGFVFNKPSEVVTLHDRVNHPNFRVLLDTCHAYMCAVAGARQQDSRETLHGGIAEFLDMLKNRIGAIHLIDSDGTLYSDETSTHCPFGAGNIDFESLAPQLLAIHGIEWWCIDLCFWPGAWELVESSLGFVQNLLTTQAAGGSVR